MASKIYYSPFIPLFSGNGLPVANGKLYFFYTGTTNPAPIYSDPNLTIPLENPVIADAGARLPNIYLDETITYRVRATNKNDVPLTDDADPYIPGADISAGPPGPAGGNIMAIPLFVSATGITGLSTADLVHTSGHTQKGIGSAFYVYDAAVDAAYVAANPLTSFLAASNRGYRLSLDQIITPHMFGALGDALSADDGPALQAWMTFFATKYCLGASGGGDRFITGQALTADFTAAYDAISIGNNAPHTRYLWMNFSLVAKVGSSGNSLVTFKKVPVGVNWSGRPRLEGTGNYAGYTARTWANGLQLEICGQFFFDGVYCESFAYAGVVTTKNPDNNNGFAWNTINAKRCGSGYPSLGDTSISFSTTIASRQVNTGSANSFDQRGNLTLTAVWPHAFFDDATYTKTLNIGGKIYQIREFDRAAKTVAVYPWPPASVVAGQTVTLHAGAALVTRGNDSNVFTGQQIYALGSGGALDCQSLYGGSINSILCELGGDVLRLGAVPGSDMFGLSVEHIYGEGVLSALTAISGSISFVKIGTYSGDFDLSSVQKVFEVSDGTNFSNNGLPGVSIGAFEGEWFRKNTRIEAIVPLDFSRKSTYDTVWTGNHTDMEFQITAVPSWLFDLFREDGFPIHCAAPAGISPTGAYNSIKFTAPGGWTVNGGADVTFRGFTGVSSFRVFKTGATALEVKCVAGREPEGRVGVSANRGDNNVTLAIYTDNVTQRFAAALTADRTITLPVGTAADNGAKFRIVREATATGAFNLIIGSLKNLTAAGQWAEIENRGGPWMLTGYGTL